MLIKEESIVHQTTAATLVLVAVAIDKLLNTQGLEVACVDEAGALNRTNGREGPARAAHALVLHFRNGTLFDPVHLLWKMVVLLLLIHLFPQDIFRRHASCRLLVGVGLGDGGSSAVLAELMKFLELLMRHVTEGVVTQNVRRLGHLIVVLLDEGCDEE